MAILAVKVEHAVLSLCKAEKPIRPLQEGRLVSIGMPVYNGGRFLRQSLKSLLGQSFRHFELIISDNASTDDTAEICIMHAAGDSRIRYIRQAENIGVVANFRFVLEQSNGEYFMWAAADDEWLPSFIEKCVRALEVDQSAGFAVTRYAVESRLSPLLSRWSIPPLTCVGEQDRQKRVSLYTRMPFDTHKDNLVYALWRRAVISSVLADISELSLSTPIIGASMNEYALALHRGAFVNQLLFRKLYRFVPPGHVLASLGAVASRVLRRLTRRAESHANGYCAEQHLRDLRAVLQRASFSDPFISSIVDVNERHIRCGKGKGATGPR